RRALETIRQAIELEPYNAEAHLILADLYREQERWKEATQSYIRALRFSPVGVAAQSGLGQVYLYQDQSQPAEAQFQVVVSLDPKAVDGYAGLCTIYLQQDKTAKALPQCEQAATLDEKSADRRRQWANALLREGRPQEAAKILQALVDEDPEDDLGHYLLGLAYRDLKEYADAQTEIEIYQDLSGSDDFRIQVLIGALKESYVLRQDKAIADLAQFGESVLKYPVNVQVETTGGLTRTLTIRFRAQKGEEPQQTYQSMFSLAGIAAMIAPRVEPAFNGGTLIRAETAQGQPFLTLRFAARDLSAFLDGFLSSQQFVAKMQFVPEPSDTKGGELTDKDFKATTDGIATLRGLAAKKPVGFQRLTQQALEERLQGRMDTKAREASQHSQALLRLLGVIGPDVDLEKLSQDLAAEQVLGFYDYEKQTFYVVGGKAASSVADRLVIAHEYVHALQDQNFGMGEILRKEENGDRRLALSALIEGDASLSSYTYIQTETPIQDQVQLFSLSQGGIQKEALEASPPVLRDSLVFPYSQGLTFVTSIHEAGGWKAVNELYGKPPASTEQILHPERYRKGDAPVDVSLPDVAAALGGDWRLVDDDLMGELGWRLTLTAYLGPATAEVAAEGWGGDDYALLQQGSTETYALVLNTVFDEEAEAEEFWALLRVALDHRAGYTQIVKDLTGADPARQWRGAGDYWVARRAGKSVLIVIGPSEEVTQKLLAVAAGS
ncbi:MAG: tetratricopeptide repeat protein, partial [Anaerolineae bacterium]|nr:tetratricopeptide repeat protein [Anaerolineae bacterium]